MKAKKNKSKNLEGKRKSLFLMGALASLSVILMAFEWSNTNLTYIPPSFSKDVAMNDEIIVEMKFKPKPKQISKPEPKRIEKLKVVNKILPTDSAIVFTPTFIPDFGDVEDDTTDDVDGIGFVAQNLPVGWAEQMPEYPGGLKEMYTHLGKKAKYTFAAKNRRITGEVHVQFVIEKDGSVSNVKILKGLGFGLDKNAMDAIKSFKNWKPGRQGTELVRVRMSIPIKYKLGY